MSRKLAVLRVAAILLGGAATLWIATGVTLNLTMARRSPALVEAWWPAGAMAKVARGTDQLTTAPRLPVEKVDRLRATLRDAALREPLNTEALSTLAAFDEFRNDSTRARLLFRASEAVSRRNTVAELWLIEDAVSRGDIAEAITHYNRALLVEPGMGVTLLPILVGASSDPAILRELLPTLARRPLWWKDYMLQLGTSGDNATTMATVLRAIRLDIRKPEERSLAQTILRRMVALKDGRGAIGVANRLEGAPGSARSLREGNFEASDALLPFGWWLRDESSIRAYRETVPDGSMGLRIITSSGASGGVAQQLIGLEPGRYNLQGTAGDISNDQTVRPAIEISCENGKQLSRSVLPASNGEGRGFRFAFEVPAADCPLQWVTIITVPADDTNIWLDNLTIER